MLWSRMVITELVERTHRLASTESCHRSEIRMREVKEARLLWLRWEELRLRIEIWLFHSVYAISQRMRARVVRRTSDTRELMCLTEAFFEKRKNNEKKEASRIERTFQTH